MAVFLSVVILVVVASLVPLILERFAFGNSWCESFKATGVFMGWASIFAVVVFGLGFLLAWVNSGIFD
jgi:hypothetical protein